MTNLKAWLLPNGYSTAFRKRKNIASKHLLTVSILGLALVLPVLATDRNDDVGRIEKSTQVFQEIMQTPDQGIPQDLLERAKCVAIIPGEEKAAFISEALTARGLLPAALLMAGALPCLWLSAEGASASR